MGDWAAIFGPNTVPTADAARYPAMREVRAQYVQLRKRNLQLLESMTEADLDAKFLELVTLRAGEAKAQHLAPLLKGLDTAANLDDVMRELELPAATIAAD